MRVKTYRPQRAAVDDATIDRRVLEFTTTMLSKPYQKQKSALEQQLSAFLSAYTPPKDVTSCTADDIIRFLISKDRHGRTAIHREACPREGCDCPKRLAAGSVDSLLGKLRAIFNNLGRLHDSNPVSHPKVKAYLKFVREEQAGKAVTPSQAVPLFIVKFRELVKHLADLIRNSSVGLSKADKYILVRDSVFFIIDFFTGDRASDLGRLLSSQVFKLKDRTGFLLRLTLTKNVRGDGARQIILEPFQVREICPVLWLEYYLKVCRLLSIDLSCGFFFRACDNKGAVSERPFVGSAVNNRLRKHLSDAKMLSGETPHSFRVGLSNTLNILGCPQEEISRYLGWRSAGMVRHYTRQTSVASSSFLSDRAGPDASLLERAPVSHNDNLLSPF